MSDSDWLDKPEASKPTTLAPLSPEQTAFAAAWSDLSAQQQTVLAALQLYNFNFPKTNKNLEAISGNVDRKTFWRWKNENESFAFALAALKAQALEQIGDNTRILLRLDEIAEGALEPQQIYFKGVPAGTRVDYSAALKATELQMKNRKMLGDAPEGGFGGRTINLNIQVVTADGALKDARATGVTIDVPVIEVNP